MSCDWTTGLVLVLLGLLSHIVGFASPYWVLVEGFGNGLWQVCREGSCVSFMMVEGDLSAWFHAVQALALGGMLTVILAFFTTVLYIRNQSPSLALTPGLLAITSGVLIGTGVLVYAVKEWNFSNSLGWAFYMECGSTAVLLISSLILFVAAGKTRRKSKVVTLSVRHTEPLPTTEL